MLAFTIAAVAGMCLHMFPGTFLAPAAPRRPDGVRTALNAYESGKLNLGVEVESEAPTIPKPVMECDEQCMTAIVECVEEGCSVEALMKLDQKLAEDEQKVADTISEISAAQKTAYSEENVQTVAWLNNFLGRSGTLRAQLASLNGAKDTDFLKQFIKAASVAFGGGRPNDYPAIGVSGYAD